MKYLKYSLLGLSILFLSLNFIDYNIVEDDEPLLLNEKFDDSLLKLNSLQKLETYVDSIAEVKKIPQGSFGYAILAKNVISDRFYHKYATQNLDENWIASVAQKATGLFLSSKITANDILTRPYGYCGQQNMVLFELLEDKGLNCRVVFWPKHFAIQSYINGKWTYFDSNLEPVITDEQRVNEKWLYNPDSLAIAYNKDLNWVATTFGNPVTIKYGKIDEKPGAHALLFQKITKVLSRIAFLFPLLWFVYLTRKKTILAASHYKQTTQRRSNHFYRDECVG